MKNLHNSKKGSFMLPLWFWFKKVFYLSCRIHLISDVKNEQKNQEKKKRTLEEGRCKGITYHKEK